MNELAIDISTVTEDYIWAELRVGDKVFGGEGFCTTAHGYAMPCTTKTLSDAGKTDLYMDGLAADIASAGGRVFESDQAAYDHCMELVEDALAERADELEDERICF